MKIETEEMIFNGPVEFSLYPRQNILKLAGGITTFKATGINLVISPSSSATVTSITGGIEGQRIGILGNGNLTLNNNSVIKTNTGANKNLAANKVYYFTMYLNVWYEDA